MKTKTRLCGCRTSNPDKCADLKRHDYFETPDYKSEWKTAISQLNEREVLIERLLYWHGDLVQHGECSFCEYPVPDGQEHCLRFDCPVQDALEVLHGHNKAEVK